MARRVEVTLIDDIDGKEAARTLEFSIDGSSYEIDLSEANIEKFNKAVAEFVDNARRVRGGRRGRGRAAARGGATAGAGVQPGEVRAWATEQGIAVNERGRIPKDVMAAYAAAHGE